MSKKKKTNVIKDEDLPSDTRTSDDDLLEKNEDPAEDENTIIEKSSDVSDSIEIKNKKGNNKFNISEFISTFLLTVFAVITVGFLVLKLMGYNVYFVLSSSMEPAYPVNSIVFSKSVDPETIKVGDTISFYADENMVVTHRVASIDNTSRRFTTKGDANEKEDEKPVSWNNVIGKVMFALPFGGNVLRVITARENRSMLIIIIALLVVGTIVWDVAERIIKKKQKQQSLSEIESGLSEADFPKKTE